MLAEFKPLIVKVDSLLIIVEFDIANITQPITEMEGGNNNVHAMIIDLWMKLHAFLNAVEMSEVD